jgi:uncharacterized protein
MERRWKVMVWTGLALLVSGVEVSASQTADDPANRLSHKQQAVLSSRTFLNGHPDMKYRSEGWEAYQKGDYAVALGNFTRAASYGDKPSQAMLAEMYWQGRGVPIDRAMGYAWADVAAERGYPVFVGLRERYWLQLQQEERARVLESGPALMAEYGDAVTKERLARHMRQHVWRAERSALTAGPPAEVRLPGPNGDYIRIDGRMFHSPAFWDPAQYQAWQDAQWKDLPKGKVDVGDVETVAPTE